MTPKIRLFEFNVLVRQDEVKTKTAGGILLPDDVKERNKHSETWGEIIDLSPMAFNADIWPGDQPKPKPGDRVYFARHAGSFVEIDGTEYRVIKDKDVVLLAEAAA